MRLVYVLNMPSSLNKDIINNIIIIIIIIIILVRGAFVKCLSIDIQQQL